MKSQSNPASLYNERRWRNPRSIVTALSLLATGFGLHAQIVAGNISPQAIEIDVSANLFPTGTPGFTDWVKDSLTNTDTAGVSNTVATGIIPGVSGAVGGKGHWPGVRIVDGISGADQDIFLSGGKENDTSTWTVGPGSVGSSKYDITQAYLANNNQKLFFGMERRGNNGSTAFDFEFNQAPPNPAKPYIPVRTLGDILFTFELSGSGSSGSSTPHYFIWNGAKYVEQIPIPASMVSTINNAPVTAAPWGFVNSQGNWALGSLDRFSFAEASVNLSDTFPGFVPCNGTKAYTQVRTRSSATDTSDLKDTTKIFGYSFGGPLPVSTFSTTCSQELVYSAIGSKDSSGGTNNVSAFWEFAPPAGATLSGSGVTGPDGSGLYHSTQLAGVVNVNFSDAPSASVNVTLHIVDGDTCSASLDPQIVVVPAALAASITEKTMNGSALSVTLTGSAPSATAVQWQRLSGGNWVNIPGATTTTLVYSSFEADSTPTVLDFDVGSDPFQGKVYIVQVRIAAQRIVGSQVCTGASLPMTLKKIVGVDP